MYVQERVAGWSTESFFTGNHPPPPGKVMWGNSETAKNKGGGREKAKNGKI